MNDESRALTQSLGDRYQLDRELGRGGMGTVYLARDRQLDRPVALKVLPTEFARVPDLRARFLRETKLAAGFSHPNIVPVFAIEEHDDVLAFAMGYVEGESLAARVAREGPLAQRDVVRLLQDVAYALAYAHGRGVVHRDVKPDNIMIERATSRALIMDFGIARAISQAPEQPGLTRVGEVVGTPEYMSPEQASGDTVDGRSDLYSLGLVAWFALAGRAAMTGETTQRILVRQLTEAVPPIAAVRPDLPAALCAVVDRCCVKEPTGRYASAEALVEALAATQLATPDVPVAVRLLAPELTAVFTRSLVAVTLIGYGNYRLIGRGNASIFAFGLVAVALTWVKTVTTVQELRRLRRAGFTVTELQRLLTVVQLERDSVRAQRRLDPALVQRRRRRVIGASVIFVWQVVTIAMFLQGKISEGDANIEGRRSVLVFFASLLAASLSAAVLASSPFRRPLVEQLFSTVWLGRFGHWLMSIIGGGAREFVVRPAAQTAAKAKTLASLTTEVGALEARVARLEQRDRP